MKIWSLTVLAFMSIQFLSLPVTVYLYQNHNATLTESCCENIKTDPSCKAKCVLTKTEKNQKETNQLLKKQVASLYFQEIATETHFKLNLLERKTKGLFYKDQYSFSYLKLSFKPPQVIIS